MDIIMKKGMDILRKIPNFPAIQSKSKYEMLDFTLSFMGVAFEEVSRLADDMKEEIADWNDGRKCAIGVLPNGPYINFEKKGDMLYYRGKGQFPCDVTFLIKNYDSAIMIFTAQMSSHQAAAECRALVDGNNSYAMELNRVMAIVETYLFPSFVLKMILKKPPKLTPKQLVTKGKVYSALLPALIKKGLTSN